MANTEYDHCFNCLFWKEGYCTEKKEKIKIPKKGWCGEHLRRTPFDANDIAVEYEYRRDHAMAEMSGHKVRPIEDILKGAGWDGVGRLKQGKFPEDKVGN